MATAATVPSQTPATEQARKPGGTRSPAPLRPPAPLKASQLPIIRLAASLRDSLASDNGSPPIASRCSSAGAVAPYLLQDTPHTYARRGAPAAPTGPGSNCRLDFMLATLVGNGAAWSVATLPAIKGPANPPTNAILRVRMFSSVSCWEIPQARTAARAELGPLGIILDRIGRSASRPLSP